MRIFQIFFVTLHAVLTYSAYDKDSFMYIACGRTFHYIALCEGNIR